LEEILPIICASLLIRKKHISFGLEEEQDLLIEIAKILLLSYVEGATPHEPNERMALFHLKDNQFLSLR
jgi:hypothetical protein